MTDYAKWDRMVVDSDSSDEEQASASQSADVAPTQPPASALKDARSLMEHMAKIEALGEEIVDERAQMVDLDRKRQGNREALRVLRKAEQASPDDAAGSKYWVCFGDTFYRRSHELTRKQIEEEQRTIETEIERLRGSVKRKSSRLCELDPSITGGSEIHKSFVSLHGVTSEQLALQFGGEVGAL